MNLVPSSDKGKGKGKAVSLQARGAQRFPGTQGSQVTWQWLRIVVRLSDLRTGRFYPQEILLVFISVIGWVDPTTIVRSEGFYVNEKFEWRQLGLNQRPSDLQHSVHAQDTNILGSTVQNLIGRLGFLGTWGNDLSGWCKRRRIPRQVEELWVPKYNFCRESLWLIN